MNIIGHAAIIGRFERLIQADTLGHAFIFSGPPSVGKTTMALWLAAKLLNTETINTHPDFIHIQLEPHPKTGKTRELISVEQIQAMRARLSHSALSGGYKMVLIEDANTLSTSASNALLKTLEEPRGRTCLVLTTPCESALLPTVRSRAQTVRFHRVAREVICDALNARGASRDEAHTLAGIAAGCPGMALSLASNPEALTQMQEDRRRAESCFSPRISERILAVRDMIPAYRADHVETRAQLQARVAHVEALARDRLLASHGCAEIASDTQTENVLTPRQSIAAVRAIRRTARQLNAHVDPHLALIDGVMNY